jgi:hypothetical protein
VTGESLGLLIEEASANLIHYSEPDSGTPDGSNANGTWNFNDLDKNTEIDKVEGPDGVSNSASRMQLASGTQWDLYVRITNLTAGEKCTFSGWVRLGTATNFTIHVNNGAAWDTVADGVYSFDASDGLNTTSFVKISHTFTIPANGRVNVHIGRHQGTAPAQQTAGTVDVWGFQFERKSFATSTIRTSGAAVTRAADIAEITGTNFSGFHNTSEGTYVIETDASTGSTSAQARGFVVSDGTSSHRIATDFKEPNALNLFFQAGGSATALASNIAGLPRPIKAAITYKAGDYRGAYDGQLALTSTFGSTPVVNQLSIGSQNFTSDGYFNGHIKSLTYYNTLSDDATLETLTTP